MRISIITPVLNGARTIDRTLQSLSVQRGDFEHVVMDGGSKDETARIVARYEGKYPVKYFSQPDKSLYEGLWNGYVRSSGEIMGMINADDFYMPWTLAVVRQVFTDHPEVQWITGIPSWFFEDTGLQITSGYAPVYLQSQIAGGFYSNRRFGFLQQESIFWRRSLWESEKPEIERLIRSYRYAVDFHLWRLFARHAPLRTVGSVLACFTISGNQISGQLLSKYLAECGQQGDSFDVKPVWKLVSRCIAFARFRQVIRPCALKR